MATPEPGPSEVRVQVHAIGINFADCLVRLGVYGPAKRYVGWPITPGFEVAGVVDAIGHEVRERALLGRPVIALSRFGAYATVLTTSERRVLPLPNGWSMADGAAFAVPALTAHHALHLADAPAGATVLVHSAAGGVGHWLVQLARARGLGVTGSVGHADKRAAVLALGAERCVVRGDVDDRALVGDFLAAFDAQAPSSWRRSYDLLAPTGRLVVYGAHGLTQGGRIPWLRAGLELLRRPRFDPLRLCSDNKGVLGFNLAYLFDRDAAMAPALSAMAALVAQGSVHLPPITRFPFVRAADAHRHLESGRSIGKLVLEVDR